MESMETTQTTSCKDRLYEFLRFAGLSARQFQLAIGVSVSYVHNITGKIGEPIIREINRVYPELNTEWLQTGEGEMINKDAKPATKPVEKIITKTIVDKANSIPLLPISAQAGSLSGFAESVTKKDCEMIISPVRDAELAITVTGESMTPEFPNGSKILIKKINHKAFIDWGKAYVLDTCNGVVIKNLFPGNDENCLKCVSVNPAFPSFEIDKEDIFGVYAIVMCLSLK